jgi:hypothetical protein
MAEFIKRPNKIDRDVSLQIFKIKREKFKWG